jgi:uncharacterized tellurite resistance protein B-like protein
MIVIYGTRGITFTKEKGIFHCPSCQSKQDYRYRAVRRFFTLFFIPLIPLDKVGEYVECDRCRGTFISQVLANVIPDKDFRANYEEVMQHILIKMMLADGKIEETEKTIVLAIINRFASKEIDMNQFHDLIEKVKSDSKTTVQYLKLIRSSLNEKGKELIIRSAILVSISDGEMAESERKLIMETASILEFSNARTKELIAENLNTVN